MSTSNNGFFFEQDENKPCGEIIGASEQVVTEGENASTTINFFITLIFNNQYIIH